MEKVNGKLFPGSGIAGQNRRALVNEEAGMPEAIENFDGRPNGSEEAWLIRLGPAVSPRR